MATVTLLWAAESTGGAYNTISGSATFSLAGGETLAIVIAGFSTADVGAPTDSAGTLVKQTAAYNAFNGSSLTHGGWYTEANAAAGSHTITPPTIAGGSDALIGVIKIDGMPSTLNVRDAVKKQQVTSSNTFALTTTGTPQAGDVVLGARWHENSAGSTDTITRPSGWTGLWQYLNGAVNLPTDNSYVILGSSGNFTATWTDVDPAITDTTGAMLVLVPNAGVSTLSFDEGIWQPLEQQTNPLTVSLW